MADRLLKSKQKSVLPLILAAPNAYHILVNAHRLCAPVLEEVRQSLLFCFELATGGDRQGQPGAVYAGWGEFTILPLWQDDPQQPDIFILSAGDGIYWPHIPEEVDYPHALKLKHCKPLPFAS